MRLLLNNQEGRIIKMETKLINYISMLEEEIKRIKNEWYSPNSVGDKEKYFRDHLQKYREEIKELKADYKVEINTLIRSNNKRVDMIKELKAENDRLREANKHKEYSHYPKEYVQEANEYLGHNDKFTKVLFFMVDGNEFEWNEDNDGMNGMNGEFNGTLYADDCIAEIDNT